MIILTGRNLGERQRDLNTKVKEATEKHVDFKQIKDTPEECDVDKLFKIDLASTHKNIEYIIEVLKSGDSLYISRALKCTWLYDNDFDSVINPNNLHDNVMPFMSTKMKKKLLTAISTHVRCEKRAASFYKFCMDIKFTSIALKFLNFTSETFKIVLLQDELNCNHLIVGLQGEYLKHFIGPSFNLADAYVAIFHETNGLQVFRELSYLHSVSDVKYLDLVENYVKLSPYNDIQLGLRISKSIMKKHKDRVLKNPSLYVRILSKSVLVKHTTAEDAKQFAVALLPKNAQSFWNGNFCNSNKFFLDKITVGKFRFIKEIFTAKYPEQEFETNVNFYNKQCYNIMTLEERETWALSQLACEAEILGIGKDYLWYKFVSFEKAFKEIKKLVMVTSDNTKRSDMLNILVESAKNQRDVEKLVNHYYERHVNEQKYSKEAFLDRLLQNFNIYEFDADCWAAWNKMFHNLEVYSLTDCFTCKTEYKLIALVYSIINENDIHEALKLYCSNLYFYSLKCNTDRLPKEQQEMVFNYLFTFYMGEIIKSENKPYDDDVKHHLRKYVHFVLDLLDQYDRTRNDIPELVNHFMKLDWDEFQCHRLFYEPAESTKPLDLLHDLKEDAKLLVENLPLLKSNIDYSYTFNINIVLKKLKIYFSNDIAKDYLQFFNELLSEDELCHKVAQAAAHGIFQLGDEILKVDFMTKFAPTEPKINHAEISEKLLRIQEAICSHAFYSRPPVPLKYMLMYIKGDYVHFCLPMFQSYLANLPLPLCMKFIEAILDTPVSIQKHGIRLAFECFNPESLNKLVLRAWTKTENVSLRMIIFKAIFNKISESQVNQDGFYDTLKIITSTLREDDDDEVFKLLVSRKLPSRLIPEYIEAAWKVVSQLPFKPANLNRIRTVIDFIDSDIDSIRQDFVRDIVETFIASVLKQEEGDIKKPSSEATSLIEAKWHLTTSYIIHVRGKEDLDKKIKLTKLILDKYLGPLESAIRGNKYVFREHCIDFINNLERKSYSQDFHRYENVNIIMQFVLQTLQDMLPIEEIYLELWELRLGLMGRKVIADAKTKLKEQTVEPYVATKDIAIKFANELGILIKEFVEKEIYFASFLKAIFEKITNEMEVVKNQFDTFIRKENMAVAVSFELTRFEITEIYYLILLLISTDFSPEFEEDFKFVINCIKKLDNKEIRCNLYRKFVCSEYVVNEFMHS